MHSLIDDLLDPASLPDRTGSVSLVQTHISLVFVGDEFVYKVKKPVDFGFLDFTTIEKRRYYCEQEVRLNSRLSKGLYLDVLPVVWDGERHRVSAGGGQVVDYAVRMRRIPEHRLMKSVFSRGELGDEHLRAIATRLARFQLEAETSPEIEMFGEPERFRINTDENFAQIEKYIGQTIDRTVFDAVRGWTEEFYRKNHGLFMYRIQTGRIRDCHGDLHMEHICLADEIVIFDCIEFNDRFRYSDTVSDIAFLLMDLEFHGGGEAASRLWGYYRDMAEETEAESLLTFYKVYRACVRGKVNNFQLDDGQISTEKKAEAAERARKYFRLAGKYIHKA